MNNDNEILNEELLKQLKSIEQLQLILDEENLCLKEKSFKFLDNILLRKQESLVIIAKNNQLLSTEKAETAILQDEILLKVKEEIEEKLNHCKKTNEINGQLVSLSMRSNKHLMQIFTQASGTNTVTYDQKGTLTSATLLGKDIKA